MVSDFIAFLQKTPFFRLLFALICGILFQSFVGFSLPLFIICTLTSICLLMCCFYIKDISLLFRLQWTFGLGVFLFLFAMGMWVTQKTEQDAKLQYIDEQHTYTCRLVDEPVEKEKSVLCHAKLQSVDGEIMTDKAKVLFYLPKDTTSLLLQAGDQLLINTTFSVPQPLGNPCEFDYGEYLRKKGISGTAYVFDGNWQKLEGSLFSILSFSHQCRKKLLSIYEELGITGDEYAVLAALTLGYKDALTEDLKDSYSVSGAMHILAVSGLHVGVVYMVLSFFFSFLNRKSGTKVIQAIIIVLFLWLYAFITGLAPSVIRATTMFSLVAFAMLLNRRSQTYNTIFVAAFGMLFYNPYYLFDVGFQLSYSAVLSIIFFQPRFYALLTPANKFLDAVWGLFTVSLAAQLGTAIIGLFYFNQFSNYFWLTNIVVVPAASVIIYLAVALFFLHWIPYVGEFFALLLTWVVKAVNTVVDVVYNLPYAVYNMWLEKYEVLALFLALSFLTIAFIYRRYWMLTASFVLLVLFSANRLYINHHNYTEDKIIVAAVRNHSAVSFMTKNTAYVLTDNKEAEHKTMKSFRIKNNIDNVVLLNDSLQGYTGNEILTFAGKRVLVLSNNVFENKIVEQPVLLDYLILTNRIDVSMKNVLESVTPRQVIVDLSYQKRSAEKIKKDCVALGIECFMVAEDGAFIVRMP